MPSMNIRTSQKETNEPIGNYLFRDSPSALVGVKLETILPDGHITSPRRFRRELQPPVG
jgi:hypothetical protein